MKIFIDYITTVLIMLLSNIAWCNNASLPEDKPITATTGIRTGRVTDAMTGKPIEGAIVVCNWNITEFSMEGGDTESVAIYETITDKDGRYTIPSQTVQLEHSLYSRLTPEQMLVYKFGYIWYWMSDKEISTFMVCMPDLPHIYRRQNNVVKLQPWNNKMSHVEHLKDLPSYKLPMDKLTLLPQALAEEKILANEEKNANADFLKIVEETKKQLAADINAYKKNLIDRDEYVSRLHNYLNISDVDIFESVSKDLSNCGDTTAIPALIKFVKENAYRKNSTEKVFRCLCSAINNPAIAYPSIASDRKKLIIEIENWWEQEKDNDPAEWKTDDLAKLSYLMQAQADAWRPSYDISGEFRLTTGEVEDINDSPVMTVFKRFKAALLADDPNAVRDCFSDGIGREEAAMLIKLQPKFREIANGFKDMDMVSENEYIAKYYLLGPIAGNQRNAYPVHFSRDEKNNWKISQFSEYIKQNDFGK